MPVEGKPYLQEFAGSARGGPEKNTPVAPARREYLISIKAPHSAGELLTRAVTELVWTGGSPVQ